MISAFIFLPLAVALTLALIPAERTRSVVAIAGGLATLALGLALWAGGLPIAIDVRYGRIGQAAVCGGGHGLVLPNFLDAHGGVFHSAALPRKISCKRRPNCASSFEDGLFR